MKNKFNCVVATLIVILLFIPFPLMAVKVLYYVDIAFAFIILEICMFTIFTKEKRIPFFLSPLIVCFAFFTMVVDITTSKFLIELNDLNNQNPELFDFAQSFINFPYAGYILFIIFSIFPILNSFKKTTLEDKNLTDCFKFIKASIKVMYLVFLVSIIGGTLRGITKDNMNFVESFLSVLPFACAQITSYLLAWCMAGIGIDSLLFVKEVIKKN